jgi:uncharacterized Zn-finger protein
MSTAGQSELGRLEREWEERVAGSPEAREARAALKEEKMAPPNRAKGHIKDSDLEGEDDTIESIEAIADFISSTQPMAEKKPVAAPFGEFDNPEVNEGGSKARIIKKEKTLSCSEPGCTTRFSRPFCLRRHIEIVHDKQKYHACTELGCNQAFGMRQQLEEHGRSTHDHPWLACQVEGCKRTFRTLWNLRYHRMAVHKDQPYVCQEPGCDKTFPDKKLLQAHGRSQHSQPKMPCKVAGCVFSFCSKTGMLLHMRAIHNQATPYVCPDPDCNKKFCDRSRLDDHRRSTHGHSKLVCGVGGCTASFCSKSGLQEHKAKQGNAHYGYKENDMVFKEDPDSDWTPHNYSSRFRSLQ